MRRAIAISIVLGAISLSGFGCAWVKLTPRGEQVREETAENVVGCQDIGTAYGKTRTTALGLPRDKEVVRDEQVKLAQNQAALIGGDTVVQDGPPSGGTLNFKVYRCH
jgi:hypothetical protein